MDLKTTIFSITSLVFGTLLMGQAIASETSSISYENVKTLDPNAPSMDQNLFSINFNLEENRPLEKTKISAALRFFSESSNAIYSIPEAYIEYKFSDSEYSLGRKIVDWNPSEKFWLQGNINGRKNFSLLSEEQEGLTGFHYSRKITKNFKLDVIGSYVFVPNMNPSYEVVDGKITSKAQWVSLPPSEISLSGQVLPIYYYLATPSLEKILIQESLAFRGSYKIDKTNTKISFYGLYKPENDLRVNAEGYLAKNLDQVKVTAHPFVNHHIVYGANIAQSLPLGLQFNTGIEVVDPNANIRANLFVINPSQMASKREFDADYFSIVPVYTKKSFWWSSISNNDPIHHVSLNSTVLLSEKKDPGDDFYGDQVKWRKAIGISYSYSITDSLLFDMNIKYDFELQDNILKFESSYQIRDEYRFKLGIELIKSPNPNSYWSVYRASDTIYGDFSVLF